MSDNPPCVPIELEVSVEDTYTIIKSYLRTRVNICSLQVFEDTALAHGSLTYTIIYEAAGKAILNEGISTCLTDYIKGIRPR